MTVAEGRGGPRVKGHVQPIYGDAMLMRLMPRKSARACVHVVRVAEGSVS